MKIKLNLRQLLIGILIVKLFISSSVTAQNSHPNVFINQAEIDAIKIKVNANIEPWSSAYSQMISAANSALNQSSLSVTFGGGHTGRQYYTEKPYCGWPSPPAPSNGCIDGQINPAAERSDYESAVKLGDAVRDLGLAYAFTGNSIYADKAIDLIRAWSLDPITSMKPNTAVTNRIELFITMPGYFYGADLIWNYSGWDVTEKTDFRAWIQSLANQTMQGGVGENNFANWRLVLLASAGSLLNDPTLLGFVESEWVSLLPLQMKDEGSSVAGQMIEEVGRTKGLHYSLYAVNAMIQGAEIMRHQNVNLYDVSNAGRRLELALDYLAPYAINPSSWPYQQITTITQDDSMALYELAYSHFQKTSYLDVINRWGRPMDETRVMGINTLTHANRFDLDLTPMPPSIMTQAQSLSVLEGENASFNVVAIGENPLNFQWFHNNNAVNGATNASYTLENVLISDDGAKFYCIVSNSLGTETSNDAFLTVIADTIAPIISGAVVQTPVQVDIVFDENITLASAQNTTNYQIDQGIQVISASLNADNRTVSLQTENLSADTIYNISMNNIRDVSAAGNTIIANSSIEVIYAPIINFDNGLMPFGWIPLTASRWSVVMDNSNNALFLNTSNYSPLSGSRLGEHILTPDSYTDFTLTAQIKTNESAGNSNADYALVFGYQDENSYFYMMFNRIQNNTQLFKVANGTRQVLSTASSSWLNDDFYHEVQLSRVADSIEVRFDGNTVLQVMDTSFASGQIGLGSYNDSAYFDDIRITGTGSTSQTDLIFIADFE